MSKSYNVELARLRKERNLTRKVAAKEMGVPRFNLYLYENGYFKPNKKDLEKIEAYYGQSIDFSTYAASFEDHHQSSKPNKKKLIILGVIALLSASLFATGFCLFDDASDNTSKPYGEVYKEAKAKAMKDGDVGRDLITDLEYHYLRGEYIATYTQISFYTTNSILYFNNATASSSTGLLETHPELGISRFHFQFGGSLNQSSYVCTFSFGSSKAGIFFIADAIYHNESIKKFDSLNVIRQGDIPVTEELALELFNVKIEDATKAFSHLLTTSLGKDVDFFKDFLPAREQGRTINFGTQIAGLSMIFPSIISFFVALVIFVSEVFKGMKSYIEEGRDEHKLPKDLNINVGIPDFLLLWLSRLSAVLSLGIIILCTLGKYVITLPDLFLNEDFLRFFELVFITTPFIRQFIVVNTARKRKTLYVELTRTILVYLFIASFETSLIGVTNRWGYNIADFIYSYIPSNIFLAVALNYVICIFLFIDPKFIKGEKKWPTVLWRLGSLIPLAAIVATVIVGNSYELFYGVKKNIYLLFWVSNSRAVLSVTSILFIYAIYFTRLYFDRKYNSYKFYNGFRYNLIINVVCTTIVGIVALVDGLVATSELAYYIGFGYNLTLLAIIPFILLTRYGVNTMRISHIDDGSPINIAL